MPRGHKALDGPEEEVYESDDESYDDYDEEPEADEEPRSRTRAPAERRRGERKAPQPLSPGPVAKAVLQDVAELTGKPPSGITSLERDDEGWVVEVEVVEDSRIPSSSDVLATYRAEVADDGSLTALHRTRRYLRGKGEVA